MVTLWYPGNDAIFKGSGRHV